jgi:hypothetical protein
MARYLIAKTVATGTTALLLATGIACSKKAEAADSAYCKAARTWSVAEMDTRDDADPTAFKVYWDKYLAFMGQGVRLAPKSIHNDWVTYHAAVGKQTPVLQKYGYSKPRLEQEASADEKALFESPGDAAQAAFHNLLVYEAQTCSAAQPLAADEDFSNEKPGAYCEVVAKDNEHNGPVFEAGAAPAGVKTLVEDKPYLTKVDADFLASAPGVIREDVKAVVAWWQQRQRPVVAKYGYDIRKILLTGSDKDRRALQLTDKDVASHFARTVAYEEQVCGLGEG